MEVDVRFPLVHRWDFNGPTGVAFIDGRASPRGWHRSWRSRCKRVSLRCKIGVVERLLGERRWCRWERWCRLSPCWARWKRCRRRWWRRYASRIPKRTRGRHCKMHGSPKHRYCLMPAMLRSMRCARTIRLWRRDGGQVLAKLRDQVLGRHDVDSSHGTVGRNERDQHQNLRRGWEGDTKISHGRKCVRHDILCQAVWNIRWKRNEDGVQAAIHISFDGRSGSNTECREKHCYSKRIGRGH